MEENYPVKGVHLRAIDLDIWLYKKKMFVRVRFLVIHNVRAFCGNETQISLCVCIPLCRHDFLERRVHMSNSISLRTWIDSIDAVVLIRVLNILSCLDQWVLGSLTNQLPQ